MSLINLKHSLETVTDRVTVYTSALSDSSGAMATVVFGGKHGDRRNLLVSIASLFTLELQTDHQPSHNTPVSAIDLSAGLGSYIKLRTAVCSMYWCNCCTSIHTHRFLHTCASSYTQYIVCFSRPE